MAASERTSDGRILTASDILDCLENGNLSDIEIINGEESEDELTIPQIYHQMKRIGADVVSRNEVITGNDDVSNEVSPEIINNDGDKMDVTDQNVTSGFQYKDIVTSKKDIQWRRSRHPFSERFAIWEEEISEPESDVESPLTYFKKYIGDDIFKLMSDCTNIYALQKDVNNFRNTTPEEIEVLIALHIAIGCLKFPRVRLFWDTTLGISLFRDNMSRDRFFQLRSNLHLVNNLERPAGCTNKMFKVQPIYDSIQKRCGQLKVEQYICIDEQMVPFRGKLSIKQFVKNKPNPWGIKIFLLCGRSGLVYRLLIYQGATTGLDADNLKSLGLGASVVLHLTKNISKGGHKLFFDNYFSSYQVLQILLKNNIYAAGTIRVNRFSNPPLLCDKEMKRKERGSHDEVIDRDENIVLVKWLDNRTVNLASNFVGAEERDTVRRWSKIENKYIEIPRPSIVKQYNHSMGGVDLIDQLISLYRVFIRSKKWTLRMIFHAVDLAIANSWIEYKKDCEKLSIPKKDVMDLLAFRMSVVGDLVKVGKTIQKKRGRPSAEDIVIPSTTKRANCEVRPSLNAQSDRVDHMPHLDGQAEGKRCKQPECNKKTHFFCDKCSVHLCITKDRNCFVSFHRK